MAEGRNRVVAAYRLKKSHKIGRIRNRAPPAREVHNGTLDMEIPLWEPWKKPVAAANPGEIPDRSTWRCKVNKIERFQAVRENRQPDFMPVWPRVMSQMIYSQGLLLPEVTGIDWYDVEKITAAVLASIAENDYDLAIPTYIDHAFGVPPLGGEITIPDKFGIAAGPTDNKPVRVKDDWPRVREMMSSYDIRETDPRMKGALEVIGNVSAAIGDSNPLVAHAYVGRVAAMHLFRPNADILEDMF